MGLQAGSDPPRLTDEHQGEDVRKLPVGREEGIGADLLPVGRLPGGCCLLGAAFHAASKDPRVLHVLMAARLLRLTVPTRVQVVRRLLGSEVWGDRKGGK